MDASINKLNFKKIVILDDNVIMKYEKNTADFIIEQVYDNLDYGLYSLKGDLDIDKTHYFNEQLHDRLMKDNLDYFTLYQSIHFKYINYYAKIQNIFDGVKVLAFDDIGILKTSQYLSSDECNLFFIDDQFFNENKGNDYLSELRNIYNNSYFIILTTNHSFEYNSHNKIMCDNSFIIKDTPKEEYLKKIFEIVKLQSLFYFTQKISGLYKISLEETINFFGYLSSKVDYFSDYIFEYLDTEDSSYQNILISLFTKKMNLEFEKLLYKTDDLISLVMNQYIAWKNNDEYIAIDEDLKKKLFDIQNSESVNFNVNKFFLSIGLGDVFKIDNSFYVCIQECDLSLRYDRKGDKLSRNLDEAILVLLKKVIVKKSELSDAKIIINIDNQEYTPSFKNYILCDLSILDLSSYNQDGYSIFNFKPEFKDSIEACIGQKKIIRFDKIAEKMKKYFILKQNEAIFNEFKSHYHIKEIVDDSIIFDVQRVCRLSKVVSNKISISFANDISRIGEVKNLYNQFFYKINLTNEFIHVTNKIDKFGEIFDTYEDKKDIINQNYCEKKDVPKECITVHNDKNKMEINVDIKKYFEILYNHKKLKLDLKEDVKNYITSIKNNIMDSQINVFFDGNGEVKNNIEIEMNKIRNFKYDIKNNQNQSVAELELQATFLDKEIIIDYDFVLKLYEK